MYSKQFKFCTSLFLQQRIFGGNYFEQSVSAFSRGQIKTRGFACATNFPSHADVVVVGGAAVGSSIAYFLKNKTGVSDLKVVVIEKDPAYTKCSTVLSVGGVRQQFSLPENIQMSLFGAEFLQTLKQRFGSEADAYFVPNGYLMLASEKSAQVLLDNAKIQKDMGAISSILSKEALKKQFPWLNVTDVEAGCYGLKNEGWFDPWALLNVLKQGAKNLGAEYLHGQVVGFSSKTRSSRAGVDEVHVKLSDGSIQHIRCGYCVIAAGAESGAVAKLAQIGTGSGVLAVPLPVERRKRYVYCFKCQDQGIVGRTPLTIDYSGAYFRRESSTGSFIGGLSPTPDEEPDVSNLDVDYQYFDNNLWPLLAHRIPAFNNIKVSSAWAGYYDFNTFDKNGIIGVHPHYSNLYFATGFSGHGIQQSPATGRAISELIVDGGFKTIDLTNFGFDRIVKKKPMYEVAIV